MKATLAAGRIVAMDRASGGDLVENAAGLAELGLGFLDVLGLDGLEEQLDLVLDPPHPPAIAGLVDGVLTNSFLGGERIGHGSFLSGGKGEGLDQSSGALSRPEGQNQGEIENRFHTVRGRRYGLLL